MNSVLPAHINIDVEFDRRDGDDLMTTLMKMVTTMIAPSMYVIVNQCSMVSGVWKTGDDRYFQPKESPADSLTLCAIFQKRVSSKISFNTRCFFQVRCGPRLQSRKLFAPSFQKKFTNKNTPFPHSCVDLSSFFSSSLSLKFYNGHFTIEYVTGLS